MKCTVQFQMLFLTVATVASGQEPQSRNHRDRAAARGASNMLSFAELLRWSRTTIFQIW
jgi:hypothetical protein